tara:strand:- start:9800 stop:10021 length:222 start_codon:yes stop_codon:yes gene_type:complete
MKNEQDLFELLLPSVDMDSIIVENADGLGIYDYADAYIAHADYKAGGELSDDHYEVLNNELSFVYDLAWEQNH